MISAMCPNKLAQSYQGTCKTPNKKKATKNIILQVYVLFYYIQVPTPGQPTTQSVLETATLPLILLKLMLL